jgi:hypothetical protein
MTTINNSEPKLPNILPNDIVTIVARKNSGKTHMIKALIHQAFKKKHYKWVIVISPTAFNGDYAKIIGKNNVFSSFDPESIDAMLNHQEALIKKNKGAQGVIIMDDCLGTVDFNHRVFSKLFSTNRHFKVGVWCTTQKFKALPTIIRGNADKVILLNSVSDTLAKSLHEEYSSDKFESWRHLQQYCHCCTQNYGAVCIDIGQTGSYTHVRAPSVLPNFNIKMKR